MEKLGANISLEDTEKAISTIILRLKTIKNINQNKIFNFKVLNKSLFDHYSAKNFETQKVLFNSYDGKNYTPYGTPYGKSINKKIKKD